MEQIEKRILPGHELVGHRRAASVGSVPLERLVALWLRATSRIVKHGFVIELADLEPPRTGIFDGLRIVIDPDVPFEMQCFVLVHLFGHSVQWVAPSLAAQLTALQTTTDHDNFMQVLHDYEYQAARFALSLMREAGIGDLDAWLADFVETDWRYVEGFYRTGEIPRWENCVAAARAPVEPLPIPPLMHRRVEVRYAF
ncbi:MAG TPA: hypothetical protein VHZ24_13220 [Pirellulales bacterium]|jgi:hypothetical protein|nr:hypothetical protein [Pirellulales bacterium]